MKPEKFFTELEIEDVVETSNDRELKKLKARVSDPVAEVKILCRSVQENYYDIAAMLVIIKDNALYVDETYSHDKQSFKDWCDNELEGVKYRTAQYWINIYSYFTKMGISKEEVMSVGGWAKVKELVGVAEEADALREMMQDAKGKTVEQLRQDRATNPLTVSRPSEFTKLTFSLPNAVADNVLSIIEEEAKNHDNDKSRALVSIVNYFSQLIRTNNVIAVEEGINLDIEELTT